jgi:hypothetical protein
VGHRTAVAALAAALAIGAAAEAMGQTTAPPKPATAAPAPAKTSWRDRMFFGGGVGLGFGDVDFVSIEPLLGVRMHTQVTVGAGLLYRWAEDNRYDPDLDTTDYGARAFTQYFPVPGFFLQAEYEYLDYEYLRADLSTDRDTASSIFAGGGISQPLGGQAGFYAAALYNFSYNGDDLASPYDSPWVIRVGVTAGF